MDVLLQLIDLSTGSVNFHIDPCLFHLCIGNCCLGVHQPLDFIKPGYQLRNFALGGDRNFKNLTTLLDCEFLSEFGFAGSRFTLKQQRFFQKPGNMKSFSKLFVQEVGRCTFEK